MIYLTSIIDSEYSRHIVISKRDIDACKEELSKKIKMAYTELLAGIARRHEDGGILVDGDKRYFWTVLFSDDNIKTIVREYDNDTKKCVEVEHMDDDSSMVCVVYYDKILSCKKKLVPNSAGLNEFGIYHLTPFSDFRVIRYPFEFDPRYTIDTKMNKLLKKFEKSQKKAWKYRDRMIEYKNGRSGSSIRRVWDDFFGRIYRVWIIIKRKIYDGI